MDEPMIIVTQKDLQTLISEISSMRQQIEFLQWPKRMKLKTAAKMVNMSTKTIQNRIKEGKLHVYRDENGTPLVDKVEVLGLWG